MLVSWILLIVLSFTLTGIDYAKHHDRYDDHDDHHHDDHHHDDHHD